MQTLNFLAGIISSISWMVLVSGTATTGCKIELISTLSSAVPDNISLAMSLVLMIPTMLSGRFLYAGNRARRWRRIFSIISVSGCSISIKINRGLGIMISTTSASFASSRLSIMTLSIGLNSPVSLASASKVLISSGAEQVFLFGLFAE